MILIEEQIMDYIDDLQLQISSLQLENMQLKAQNERKDRIIQQLVEICDKWYAEIRQYETKTTAGRR